MKIYTIVAGVNGCGKSSLLGVLLNEVDSMGAIIDQAADDCLEKGICFTQETTLSGKKTLNTVRRAMDLDYYIRLYYVGLNTMEESLLRIENRVKKGGHNIDTEAVTKRFAKRFEDLLAILPYCNEATFYDNDNGFRTVAKYKNGELQTIGSNPPLWLQELMEKLK